MQVMTATELQEKAKQILEHIDTNPRTWIERQLSDLPLEHLEILMKALECNIDTLLERVYKTKQVDHKWLRNGRKIM